MKTKKNNKGFTLIELLAVIVVLAIVTVLATTTMLPLMNKAIKKAFVDEANAAIASATNVMTLVAINSFSPSPEPAATDYQEKENKVCISLKLMAEEGLYDKDIEFFTNGEYEGKVIITKNNGSSNNYTYKVVMHNDSYITEKVGKVTDSDEDIKAYKTGDKNSTYFQCDASDFTGS